MELLVDSAASDASPPARPLSPPLYQTSSKRVPLPEAFPTENPVFVAPQPLETSKNHLDSTRSTLSPSSQWNHVHFGAITASTIEVLRLLNIHIFPVRYNDTFYSDVLFVPKGYAQFAYWDGMVVGAICCRREPVDSLVSRTRQRTYIMTLGILEPYRHYKIGSALLQCVIRLSERDGVDHLYLHVQTTNTAALKFYQTFGFQVHKTIHNYYKRLEPPDCFVLIKSLTNSALHSYVNKH